MVWDSGRNWRPLSIALAMLLEGFSVFPAGGGNLVEQVGEGRLTELPQVLDGRLRRLRRAPVERRQDARDLLSDRSRGLLGRAR